MSHYPHLRIPRYLLCDVMTQQCLSINKQLSVGVIQTERSTPQVSIELSCLCVIDKPTLCLSRIEPRPRINILHPVSTSRCLAVRPRGPSRRPTKLNCNTDRIMYVNIG